MAARPFLLAIDGPAGAGKSTASRAVAAALGFALVDTGAIYRTVALAAARNGIASDDDAALGALIDGLAMEFLPRADGSSRIRLHGDDVSDAIRSPENSLAASQVSARPIVREKLLGLQRRLALASETGAVLEGRDIGTVVFPDADLKLFLTANDEVRARRRHAELASKGQVVPLAQVLHEQRQRDRDDESRVVAPLKPALDAVIIDASSLALDEVIDRVVALVSERRAAR